MTNARYGRAMAQPSEPRSGDRIAKLLARAGIASRREIERMIADGRVALDGTVLDTPATVLRSLNGVTVDGEPVAQAEPTRLFLYHKPTGLLVTERDPKGRPTIYDRLPDDLPRLVPVGRLDLNTEGLLLLTTDGGFKRQLELPATGVERSYRARAYGNVTQQQLEDLADGIEIDGIRYGPIDANIERRTGANVWIEITITEGKNREVRRVLEHLDLQVSRLIRTRYGPFLLGDLPVGGIGEVKQHEIVAFRRTLKGGVPEADLIEPPRDGFRAAPSAVRPARARPRPIDAPAPREAQAAGRGAARAPRRSDATANGIAPRPARPGATGERARPVLREGREMRTTADGEGQRGRPRRDEREARPARSSTGNAPRDGQPARGRRGETETRSTRPTTGAARDGQPARIRRGDTERMPAGDGARDNPRGRFRRDDRDARPVPTGGSARKPWEQETPRRDEPQRSGGRPARTGGGSAGGRSGGGGGADGRPARPSRPDTPRGPAGGRGAPRGGPKGGKR